MSRQSAITLDRAGVLPTDTPLKALIALVLIIGLLMVESAAGGNAFGWLRGQPSPGIFERQVVFAVVGVAVFWAVARFLTLRLLLRWRVPLFLLALAALAALFIPGLGAERNGAIRWFVIGPLSIQPSEFARVAVIVFVAGFLHTSGERVVAHLWPAWLHVALLALLALLILWEPNLSTVVVITLVAGALLATGGLRPVLFVGAFVVALMVAALLLAWAYYTLPHVRERIDVYRCSGVPATYFCSDTALANSSGSGYQMWIAGRSVSRGGSTGSVFGTSIVKDVALPEPINDFITTVFVEEHGRAALLLLVLVYTALLWRISQIALRAHNEQYVFGAAICWGVALTLAVQALIHISVNVTIFPATGMNLPLISYGGSSLIATMAMLGLVARVDKELRALDD